MDSDGQRMSVSHSKTLEKRRKKLYAGVKKQNCIDRRKIHCPETGG
jgi:hypothetical protein